MAPEAATNRADEQSRALSVPQMLHLMQLEVERAELHDYPICCLMIGLDGFDGDGELALRRRLMPAVFGVLKLATFHKKVRGLGLTRERFVLGVFPHVTPDGTVELAQDILARGRSLRLPGTPGELEVTLSIGIGHNLQDGSKSFDVLLADAETGLKVAQSAGGDRFVQWKKVAGELERLKAELDSQIEELAAVGRQAAEARPEEAWGRGLVEKALHLFERSPDQSSGVLRLKKEIIALLRSELQALAALNIDRGLSEKEEQIGLLERRIRKLNEHLSSTEEELRRVAQMKAIDSGLASIYDGVQGLASDDANAEAKREMLSNIFQANLALREEVAAARSAEAAGSAPA